MVAAHDVDDLVIRDVRITRSSAVPIAVDGASNRTQIRRVRIERVGPIQGRTPFFSGPGGGPQLSALVEGPTIKDCYIEGTTDDAIAIFSSDSAHPMSGAVVSGNLFTEAPKNNAMVQVGNTNRVRINDNTVASFSAEEDVPGKGVPQPAPLVYVEGGRSVLGTGNTYEVATSRPTVVQTRGNGGDVRVSWSLSAAGP